MTKRHYLILLILCWASLLFYTLLKIAFGYYVEIMVNSDNFIKFCNYIDNHYFLKGIVASLVCYVMLSIYYKALLPHKDVNKLFLIIFSVVSAYLCLLHSVISISFDVIKFLIVPIVLDFNNFKSKPFKLILTCIIGYAINLAFQVISAFTRNLSIVVLQDSSMISLILSIDVFIMLELYKLYRNKPKEV